MTQKGGLVFLPIAVSIPLEITAAGLLAATGIGLAVGLGAGAAYYGGKALYDHYSFVNLPKDQQAEQSLEYSIQQANNAITKSWKLKANPMNWGKPKEFLVERYNDKVKENALKVIWTHPDNLQEQERCRAIINAIDNHDLNAQQEWSIGKYDRAMAAYNQLYEELRQKFFMAKKDNQQQDYFSIAEQLLTEFPHRPMGHFAMSLAHEESNPEQAKHHMDDAIKNSDIIWHHVSETEYFSQEKLQQQIRMTANASSEDKLALIKNIRKTSLELTTKYPINLQILVDLITASQNFEPLRTDSEFQTEVRDKINIYLNKVPDNWLVRIISSDVYRDSGNLDKAKEELQIIISSKNKQYIAPDKLVIKAHKHMANLGKIEKNRSLIIDNLEKAKSLGCHKSKLNYDLGFAYYDEKDFVSSFLAFKDYIQKKPGDFQAKIHTGYIALNAGHDNPHYIKEAESLFWEIKKTCKDRNIVSQAFVGIAETSYVDGEKSSVSQMYLQKAIKKDPTNALAWRRSAEFYCLEDSRKGQLQAINCYQEYFNLNPSDTMIQVDIALLQYQTGNRREAKATLSNLVNAKEQDVASPVKE